MTGLMDRLAGKQAALPRHLRIRTRPRSSSRGRRTATGCTPRSLSPICKREFSTRSSPETLPPAYDAAELTQLAKQELFQQRRSGSTSSIDSASAEVTEFRRQVFQQKAGSVSGSCSSIGSSIGSSSSVETTTSTSSTSSILDALRLHAAQQPAVSSSSSILRALREHANK